MSRGFRGLILPPHAQRAQQGRFPRGPVELPLFRDGKQIVLAAWSEDPKFQAFVGAVELVKYSETQCGQIGLRVMAGIEPNGLNGKLLIHCSVSRVDRLPDWDEMKAVKAAFFGPDRAAKIVIPRDRDYVNIHTFCHHLWEDES